MRLMDADALKEMFEVESEKPLKEKLSIFEIIDNAPTLGKWVFRTDIYCGKGSTSAGYVCSNCGRDFFKVNGLNYCPNCGAKMKGGDHKCD